MAQEGQDQYKQVYEKAVKLLMMRMHTAAELERKLLQRKFDKVIIRPVIDRLVELKVINDEQFAEIFLDNLIRYKTYGYYGLKIKLLQRGIPEQMAERLLAENLTLDLELKIAQRLLSRKLLERQQIIDKLKRKGFRSQVISQAIKD